MLSFRVPENLLAAPSNPPPPPDPQPPQDPSQQVAALTPAMIETASGDELKLIAKGAGLTLPKRARREKCVEYLKEQIFDIQKDEEIRTITLAAQF
jgi:hypothetical protein